MRYDREVYLCQSRKSNYNDLTGDYESASPVKYKKVAHVSDMGDSKSDMLLGEIVEGSLSVTIRGMVNDKVDYIEVDGVAYLVKQQRRLRNKQTFQVVKKQ